jgi:cardiolipin synthase A/B
VVTEYDLHLGAAAFWGEAERDIARARRRILVQAMTFEGDTVGQAVALALGEAQAADRRVLVDDYTRHVINDRLLLASRDSAIRAEARETGRMFDRLMRSGVEVRVTQPIASRPLRYPFRNHKKLLVVDDAVWLGGVNFSEHNFAWHDMMVRIADPQAADFLAGCFEADWQGKAAPVTQWRGDRLTLLNLSGADNRSGFSPLLELLAGARQSLEVLSPYPTFPFLDAMAGAAARGARVTILTPSANNKPMVRDYVLRAARRCGIAVRLLPGMNHAKAALVDRETLVFGSSNFDFVSARASAEIVAISSDERLVAQAQRRLFDPLCHAAEPLADAAPHAWRGLAATAALHVADALISRLPHRPRTVPWPRLAQSQPPG